MRNQVLAALVLGAALAPSATAVAEEGAPSLLTLPSLGQSLPSVTGLSTQEGPPTVPPPPPVVPPPPGAAVDPGMADPEFSRFSLMYSPEVEFADPPLGRAIGSAASGGGVHNIGIESSLLTGWRSRLHVQLDYTYGHGYSGVRLEPLGLGLALPLIRTSDVRLELEPLVSVLDGMLLFSNDPSDHSNVTFLLGSGAEVQLNLILGALYAFASPVGVELRWLQADSGYEANTYAGAEWLWRFRVGVGFTY